jgi:Kef-type K+ transport system membrane component KefB
MVIIALMSGQSRLHASDPLFEDEFKHIVLYTGLALSSVSVCMSIVNARALHSENTGRFPGAIGILSGVFTTLYGGVYIAASLDGTDNMGGIAWGSVMTSTGIVSIYYGARALKTATERRNSASGELTWSVEPAIINHENGKSDPGLQINISF